MRFIETDFFMNQLSQLSGKYPMIYADYEDFKRVFNPMFSTGIGDQCFKHRSKNSSTPTGARGVFRFIVRIYGDVVLPLLVYSKTMKENVTKLEIKEATRISFDELARKKQQVK